jgi:hypothetical protein
MLISGQQVDIPRYRHAESRIHDRTISDIAKVQYVQPDPAAAGQPLVERRVVLDRMEIENAKPRSRKPPVLAEALSRVTRSVREPRRVGHSGLQNRIPINYIRLRCVHSITAK